MKRPQIPRLNAWPTLERFLVVFLPLFVIVSGIAVSLHYVDVKSKMAQVEEELDHGVELQVRVITHNFRSIVSDLLVLADLEPLGTFLDAGGESMKREVAGYFLSVARRKGIYDQIRFLDDAGMEVVRINFNGGSPEAVPEEQLQNKSRRYYFRDAFTLNREEVFVSPFDLNVERGEVERPLKPMIRFGTPVFDDKGEKRGVVLLNYLGANLIRNLREGSSNVAGRMMLLNREGYWLHGPSPDDEWGFMFPDRREKSLDHMFPEAWSRISGAGSGQFRTTHGLFTFATVHPLTLGQQSSTGSGKPFAPSVARMDAESYHWKVVSFVPAALLDAEWRMLFDKFVILYALVILLLVPGSWLLARSQVRRREAEEALRDSEEKFRTITNTATDAIIMMDHDGKVMFWNPAAERMFGHLRPEIIGRDLHATLAPSRYHDDYRKGLVHFREDGSGGVMGQVREFFGRRKDGTEFPVEISFASLQIKGRWFATGIVRDITVRKQMQESLNDALEEAQTASRAKSEFLAAMSHDIRTPMNAIIGMADVLVETELTTEQRRYVEVFQGAGETLLALINDILDLSKIEAGELQLERIEFKPHKLIKDSTLTFQDVAGKKGLELKDHITPDVPETLIGDETRLRQIFFNLLANAVKFTDRGNVRLEMVRPHREGEEEMLLCSVTDTGIGIPEEKQETIFSAFAQADASTTRRFGGTGLGLAICRRLAEMMGGRIWVKSEERKGSTFYFTARLGALGVPEHPRPIVHEQSRPVIDKPARERRTAVTPLRILVVEDEENNLMLIQTFLKMEPYRIDIAADGETALGMMKADRFDIVLMDIQMPGMDGLTATRLYREWERENGVGPTVIIALTAYAMEVDARKSLEAGCDGHLTKPIKKGRLLEAIDQYAGRGSRERPEMPEGEMG